MEIAVAREDLANQFRPDYRPIPLDQAALRLPREQDLREPGHGKRIDEPGDQGQEDHNGKCWTNFFQHGCSPQARCKAVTSRSMALMPAKGMTMPPSP